MTHTSSDSLLLLLELFKHNPLFNLLSSLLSFMYLVLLCFLLLFFWHYGYKWEFNWKGDFQDDRGHPFSLLSSLRTMQKDRSVGCPIISKVSHYSSVDFAPIKRWLSAARDWIYVHMLFRSEHVSHFIKEWPSTHSEDTSLPLTGSIKKIQTNMCKRSQSG